jgi:hypothetical protein
MNPMLLVFLIFAVAAVAASAGFVWGVLLTTRPTATPQAAGDDGQDLAAGSWTETGTARVISLVPTGALKSGPNVLIPPVYRRARK